MTRLLPWRRARRTATSLAVLALVAGCSGGASSSGAPSGGPTVTTPSSPGTSKTTASKTTPTPPPPPKTGICRRLDYSAISHYTNADATVPCTAPHTAYTFAVRTIPADVSVAGVSIGNKSIQDAASQGCREAFGRFIGGNPALRALSRLSVTYFLPEQRAFNQGAHWVRCDVVSLKTFNSLGALPKDVKGFLDRPASTTNYNVCSVGDPGAPSSRLVMCARPHTYRAQVALRLGGENSTYPGKNAAGPGGQHRCMTYLTDTLGAAGGYTFGWTYPTATDWAKGQRFGYCWLKSTA